MEALTRAAKALATKHGLRFVPRPDGPIEALAAQEQVDLLAVLAGDGLRIWSPKAELRFHTGTAELRVKRMLGGDRDPLLELMPVGPGSTVLDGTLGQARDALVFGTAGASVTGVESMPLLAALAEEGLGRVEGPCAEGARRIAVQRGKLEEVLAGLPDRSYDYVYLDPMFTEEVQQGVDYELFRALADPTPLTKAVAEQALRVSRRALVLKDGPRARVIKGLGLPLSQLTFGQRMRFGVFLRDP
jgi:hypothetical protein